MDDPDVYTPEKPAHLHYRLCPRCFRAVPARSAERYCANDGNWLLEACPLCGSPITSPYAHFCVVCGLDFARAQPESRQSQGR